MKEKRLEQTDEDDDEEPKKRPRVRFVSLQPGGEDPADAIEDEIPGSARLDVEPLVLSGEPFNPFPAGDPALSSAHLAADPGWARAQRKLLRMRDQDVHVMAAVVQGEERYDQPEEQYNEAGDAIEPFHLAKEREEGYLDREGNYIEYERGDEEDAWLESIEDQVEGTKGDAGEELPYPNEPVAEDPPPLAPEGLRRYRQVLLGALQGPEETVAAALRRLAGAGSVLEKFGNKGEAAKAWQERMHSGRTVAPGNQRLFDQVTEAAEVLFDHGNSDIYLATRDAIQCQLRQEVERKRAPAPAAPPPVAAAAAAVAAAMAGGAAGGETSGKQTGGMQGRGSSKSLGTLPALPADMHGELRGSLRRPAPAAAALPAEGMPSVPGAEREARGAGQEGAVHGFAAQLPGDISGELPAPAPLPQEVELGLGLPLASPTEVELRKRVDAEQDGMGSDRQQEPPALATPVGPPPDKAVPRGS